MEDFSFPYRRFSSEPFAASLLDLLETHGIPYEVVSEPEGVGSVILGSAAIPGVIVMVRPADAVVIQQLEKYEQPEAATEEIISPPTKSERDDIRPFWIFVCYLLMLFCSPTALILGLHFMTASRRREDLSYGPAYTESTRTHGKIIFTLSLLLLAYGFVLFLTGNGRLLYLISLLFSLLKYP